MPIRKKLFRIGAVSNQLSAISQNREV